MNKENNKQQQVEPYNVVCDPITFTLPPWKYDYKATCGSCHYTHWFMSHGITPSFTCPKCGVENVAYFTFM